jgi:hypothetical protein
MFSTRKQPEVTPTVRLMKAMHFGGKDLDFNRAGEPSEDQKRQPHREFWEHPMGETTKQKNGPEISEPFFYSTKLQFSLLAFRRSRRQKLRHRWR